VVAIRVGAPRRLLSIAAVATAIVAAYVVGGWND
jgi:hypothetical protein